MIARLEQEPDLKERIASGLAQDLVGKGLAQWLADGGFFNNKGEKYEGASLSRFKAAVEYLNSHGAI